MLLQIDGWWAGGKGLLFSLLDGHSKIGTTLLHDATHMAFLSDNKKEIFEVKDLNYVRKIIAAKSEYYNFEKYFRLGYINIFFSSDVVLRHKVPYDFYEFDKKWVNELIAEEHWSEQIIVEVLYRVFNRLINVKAEKEIFSCMSWPRLENQKFFFDKFPRAKSILVKRPIEDIIASRAGRKPIENTLNNHFSLGFEKLIVNGEVESIINYYNYWEKLSGELPTQVLIIEFEDLVSNREFSMKRIADFIGVDFEDTLLRATMNSVPIEFNGVSYADQINDKASALLSADERGIILNIINGYKCGI